MPRLVHSVTGVAVNVSDEKAGRLGSEWSAPKEPAEPRSESPDSSWKVADLKAYAEEREVDLGDATKKDDILAVLTATSNPE